MFLIGEQIRGKRGLATVFNGFLGDMSSTGSVIKNLARSTVHRMAYKMRSSGVSGYRL